MTTISTIAARHPERLAAVFVGAGEPAESVRFDELELRSRRLAVLLRDLGLEPGDTVAILMKNEPAFYEVFWAAMRSGLYVTPINWHLQAGEIEYIVQNSEAKVLAASPALATTAAQVIGSAPLARGLSFGGPIDGFVAIEEALAGASVGADPVFAPELEGAFMMYSSGTTGQPKGVRQPLSGLEAGSAKAAAPATGLGRMFGFESADVYLSPAPLYHAAPLMFSSMLHRLGATVVCMRRFDAAVALQAIEDHRVTTSQWVPTMFGRFLALPEEERARYDLSSQRMVLHAAAPCPVPVKRAMLDWWGPIITEYYGGTEGGGTKISAQEWLEHPGSVGRHWTGGKIHILDENDAEITEAGREGAVYFEGPDDPKRRFRYHGDDAKTAKTYRGRLFTIGDVGYLDADGYLYLTDRKSHMIISGGVNIYPQEVENLLVTHPNVEDVAVIGVPNEDLGEEVKAVIVVQGAEANDELAATLIAHCREHLAHYKCPRSVDFVDELPRLPTGKLLKRLVREQYWKGRSGSLV